MARHVASDNQSITFIGGTVDADHMPLTAGEHSSSLACTSIGNHLAIQSIRAGRLTRKQLQRVGLRPGQRVTVLSCADSGSVIVNCTKGTVGLGAAIAQHVIVTPVTEANAQQTKTLSMQSPTILPAS